MNHIVELIAITLWIGGLVIAKGFWSVLFALIFPPYAWYLVAEKIILRMGWIS